MGSRRTGVLASVAVVALAAAPARAETPRVLLVEFDGGKLARPWNAVVAEIIEERKLKVVRDAKVKIEFDTIGEEMQSIAEKHDAVALVFGSLDKNKRGFFILTVAIAVDGERTPTMLAVGRRPKVTKPFKAKLKKQVLGILKKLDAKKQPDKPPPDKPPPDEPPDEQGGGGAAGGPQPSPPPFQPIETGPKPSPGPEPNLGSGPLAAVKTNGNGNGGGSSGKVEAEKSAGKPEEKKPKKPWHNFAAMRPVMPGNRAYLRTYWDTREYAALEGLIRVRAPLDIVVVGRTTVRHFLADDVTPETPTGMNPDTFGLDSLYGPAFFSFGPVVFVGNPLGSGSPEAVRLGVSQTFNLKFTSWASLYFLTMFLPYNTTQPGGLAISSITATVGPVRSEMVTAYQWPSLKRIGEPDPQPSYMRPYVGVVIWEPFGVYAQYEYNTGLLPDHRKGLRLGLEMSTPF